MQENTISILFSILRSVFRDNPMSEADKALVTGDMLSDVIKLGKKHDVAHLVALGMLNNGLADEENKANLQQTVFQAMYRLEKMNHTLKQACEVLEKAQIPFIPLKGSVLRKHYPEPWMRTSCDIDILVHEQDLSIAISCLVEKLNYTKRGQDSHDVSLFSPDGIHLELHYDLIEGGLVNSSDLVLQSVWEHASTKKGYQYWLEISDEMFYFYHVAHMAKHLQSGGCGIRPFIDLWILDRIDGANKSERDRLLDNGELLQFANVARKLSSVWMDAASQDSAASKMEDYIIRGGVYGTAKNKIAVQQQKKGGKIQYALSRIILPYETIKFHYPILQKHRWLMPIMQVYRWFRLLFCGGVKRSMRELSYNNKVQKSEADEIKIFLDEIGL